MCSFFSILISLDVLRPCGVGVVPFFVFRASGGGLFYLSPNENVSALPDYPARVVSERQHVKWDDAKNAFVVYIFWWWCPVRTPCFRPHSSPILSQSTPAPLVCYFFLSEETAATMTMRVLATNLWENGLRKVIRNPCSACRLGSWRGRAWWRFSPSAC